MYVYSVPLKLQNILFLIKRDFQLKWNRTLIPEKKCSDSCIFVKIVLIGILDTIDSKKCGRKTAPIKKKSHYFYNLLSQTECPP